MTGLHLCLHKFQRIFLCSCSIWAFSQTTGAKAQDSSSSIVEDIVVTAQKRNQDLQEVPVSVQVISREALIQQNQTSLNALTQTTPGVFVRSGGSSDYIYIRGVGAGNGQSFDQAVPIFVDDIFYGRSRTSSATFLDLERIELLKGPQSTYFGNNAIGGALNIVTVKPSFQREGSLRALYGNHGNYALEGEATIPVSDTFSLRVAGIASGTSGWIHNVMTRKDAPNANNFAGRVTALYKPTENFEVLLKLGLAENRQTGAGFSGATQFYQCNRAPAFQAALGADCITAVAEDLPIGINNNSNSGQEGQGTKLKTNDAVLTMRLEKWGHIFTSVTGYAKSDYSINLDGGILRDATFTGSFPERYEQFSQEFRISSPTGRPIEYLAGAYYQHDKNRSEIFINFPLFNNVLSNIAPYLPVASDQRFSQIENIYAAFGALTWNATNRLKLTVEARVVTDRKSAAADSEYGYATNPYGGFKPSPLEVQNVIASVFDHSFGTPATVDRNLHRTDTAVTPSAKLQYQLNPKAMIYLSYSRGFLAGGFNSGDTTGNIANIPFKPEYVDAYEAGIKGKFFGDKVRFNLNLFRSNYHDLQVSNYTIATSTEGGAQNIVSVVRNAAGSRSEGVELETEWVLNRHFSITANAAYLHSYFTDYKNGPPTSLEAVLGVISKNLTGAPTLYAPKWSGNVSFQYATDLPDDYGLSVQLSPFLTSGYYLANATYADPYYHQDGYIMLDGRISLTSPDRRWNLDLIGKNLNNKSILAGAITSLTAFKLESRNLAIQLRYHW
jgi:iron complex outermembrane recepter protein